jgi:hypothetical protein
VQLQIEVTTELQVEMNTELNVCECRQVTAELQEWKLQVEVITELQAFKLQSEVIIILHEDILTG